ncbi:MAG: aspartate--tRNA(Asn) ligase [Candidatus Nomurabacteria bacterium]|jgi:nondiscriminating aspartyl-tRNA synthetase|nr:aspartate--tRNA(Asn) ligase [Candidatus Nomurabacteria bacterium]
MRTLAKELASKIDKKVEIKGWLHKKRLLGGLNFLTIRDRSGLIQVLAEDKTEIEKLRGMQIGTVLTIAGKVIKDDRAPNGAELHDVKITVEVPVTEEPPIEIDKPLDHKSDNLDTLFDHRVVGLRNLQEQTIFKVQAEVLKSFRTYMNEHEFIEINTPKLLAEPTEGGTEVFKMDYFGKVATLAQSPQFYKQMMTGVFERVFEINPVYRAEPSATSRHMTEYISMDGEMNFITFDDLLHLISGLINRISDDVFAKYAGELAKWNGTKPKLTAEIPRLRLAEVHEKYSKATGENSIGEDDLRPDEERWVSDFAKKNLGSEAVFVTDWAASSMKFYHRKKADNPEVAERADLIFRGIEITTISMREHRYDILVEQLKAIAHGDPDHAGFKAYLTAFKFGMPPHGGFGMGLERVTEKLVGLKNVKEASLFPRDLNRLAP